MLKKLRRSEISRAVERELWGRAAGRCEFQSCNKLVYKSPITQERVHLADKGHIYSVGETGPRGHGPHLENKKALNQIENLILVCKLCHKTIDENLDRYSADLVIKYKQQHEERILINTGIDPSRRSHVLLYGSKIEEQLSPLEFEKCASSIFPNYNLSPESPIKLGMICEHEDSDSDFWKTEDQHLKKVFDRKVASLIAEQSSSHFSVFALAPQPLLIRLGTLITDRVPAEVYQLHREPYGWSWQADSAGTQYVIDRPADFEGTPILILSLSARIERSRITSLIQAPCSIWELSLNNCETDFLRSPRQLSEFRRIMRALIAEILLKTGCSTPLHIFPAMPVACAVEFGRIRMPKADMPWVLYDQNNKQRKFIYALTIGAVSDR